MIVVLEGNIEVERALELSYWYILNFDRSAECRIELAKKAA